MTDKNTFYNMLKSNAESQPDAVAVVYDTMKVTYEKLFDDEHNFICDYFIFNDRTEAF